MMDSGEPRIFTCRFCGARNRIWPGRVIDSPHKAMCGGCSGNLFMKESEPLKNIASVAYEHPLDRKALEMMRKVPGVNTLLRFLLKELSERRLRMLFLQSSVKVTSRHLQPLHRMVEEGARALDLNRVPELFVVNDPRPNAYAIGVDEPFIVLNTAMLDVLDEKQIRGVIGHELGHIHAGHQLYRTALYLIVNFADMTLGNLIPFRDAALSAIYYALMHWSRCAELTADRAQMLVERSFDSFVQCEMKFAAGGNFTNPLLSVEEFLEQADEAVRAQEENLLNRFYASLQTSKSSHPFPVWRVGHMYRWVYDGEFLDILSGNYETAEQEREYFNIEEEEEKKSVPDAIRGMIDNLRSYL